MEKANNKPLDIDEYIYSFPQNVQVILQEIRAVIRDIVPMAKEAISYGIPTFQLNGNLVHFAAFKNHIGFYPTPNGIEEFKKELSVYKQGKGSVQFPINQPLPTKLIKKMVQYQVEKNQKRIIKSK